MLYLDYKLLSTYGKAAAGGNCRWLNKTAQMYEKIETAVKTKTSVLRRVDSHTEYTIT